MDTDSGGGSARDSVGWRDAMVRGPRDGEDPSPGHGDGEVLVEIDVAEPELHGLTMHEGALIFCCDPSSRVCRIEV